MLVKVCGDKAEGTYVEQDLEDEGGEDGRTRTEDGLARFVVLAVAFAPKVTTVGAIYDNDELECNNQ